MPIGGPVRRRRRVSLCAVLAGVVALALLAATAPDAAQAATPFRLRVLDGHLVGPLGQTVLLRGVNANAFVAYNPSHPEAVALTPASLTEMAALGFDFLRLPLSLSRLEPHPGEISRPYLDAIAAVVRTAARDGLWVLLDLHQDRYNARLFDGEADGMPDWMVRTLGLPTRPILLGVTNPAVQGAFTSFWLDRITAGVPLWRAYDAGLTALAHRMRGEAAVVGYDIMNEPNPGLLVAPTFTARRLLPFYRQAVRAIAAADPGHIVFLEPELGAPATGLGPWPANDRPAAGVVYAPHIYLPADLGRAGHGIGSTLDAAAARTLLAALYGRAAHSAAAMDVPWLVGEFGMPPTPVGDRQLEAEIALQNRYRAGSAFWLWQIRPGAYPWQVVEPDGALAPDLNRARLLASPHPTVVGGDLRTMAFDPRNGTYRLVYAGRRAAGPTEVVASSLTYPDGLMLRSSAPARVRATITAIPGARLVTWRIEVAPTDAHVELTLTPAVGGLENAAAVRRPPATTPA